MSALLISNGFRLVALMLLMGSSSQLTSIIFLSWCIIMVLRACVPVAVALLNSGRSCCDGYSRLQFHGSRSLSAGLWPRCLQLLLNLCFRPGYHIAGFRPYHIVLLLVRPSRITAPPFRLSARPPHVSCLSINQSSNIVSEALLSTYLPNQLPSCRLQ